MNAQFWEEERETRILRHGLTLVVMMSAVEAEALLAGEELILRRILAALLKAPEIERKVCPPSGERNVDLVTVMIIAETAITETETETEKLTEIGKRETPEILRTKRKMFPGLSQWSKLTKERKAKIDLSEREQETKSEIGKCLKRNRAAAVNRGGQSPFFSAPDFSFLDATNPLTVEGQGRNTVEAGIVVISEKTKIVRTRRDIAAEEIEIQMKVVATMMNLRYTVTGVVVVTHTIALLVLLLLLLS